MTPSPTSVASNLLPSISREHGQVDASTPNALKEAGNDAVRTGDWQRAVHMFTLGIDMFVNTSGEMADGAWYSLDKRSEGVLHLLCSNRSLAHLKLGDFDAAAMDAEHCCQARPDFAKGHLRLLAAIEAAGAPLAERQAVCARGIRACPQSKELREHKAALAAEMGRTEVGAEETAACAAQLERTRRIADDPTHPQHALAAGDIGSALALGAHGVAKDLVEAERYLRIGADAGDAGSQRNLGFLLLESERAEEAVAYLRMAKEQGDDDSAAAVDKLVAEADAAHAQALFKLRALAAKGDERAKAMLVELEER